MIYYYTYKITLLKGSLKDHYYLGQHQTRKLDDKYAGSGRLLVDYFKKYGKIEGETYVKEIIAFYNDKNELNKAEYELIGDKYKTDTMCLNLKSGGNQCIEFCEDTLEKFSKWERTEEICNNISKGHKGQHAWNKGLINYHKGYKISEDKRANMRVPHSTKGKHWIIDEKTGKRKWILFQ